MGGARSAARQGRENRLQGVDHPGGGRLGRRPFSQRDRGLRLAPALQARARRHPHPHRARLRLHAGRIQGKLAVAARSLRAHLLRMLLPPIAALLVLGGLVAYYPAIEPATEAYDQALIDVGISLGSYIRERNGYRLELPAAVDQVLRRDSYDTVYYRVLGPAGEPIAGDEGLPEPLGEPRDALVSYDTAYKGQSVRAVAVPARCGSAACRVLVAETTVKRKRLARDILFSTLLPGMLIACATLVIVWFGVKRGLGPLARLSEEIKARSPGDLRPIDAAGAPEEAQPLVGALNGLLDEVAKAASNQQRFLANAAHQLRTPLAGLRMHTELALAE